MAGVFTAVAVIVLILFVVIPWLWAHAIWIVAGIAILIATEELAPDRKQVAAQVQVAASFNDNVQVSGERAFLGDGQKYVSAIVHNGSNARIYDVWLRC
ncbi:hypothetical protein [Microvirga massiliensis]|uniref:hypothetical protein n=1 Tax=Microvirga massiliensis TaxID=1033741 RepID=UPI00062B5EBA|nr:hypothetical protein [Microvirga massiliensis]